MLLALTMVLTLCLTGCGDSGGGGERTVNVCGWGENIDPELIDRFEQETGIQVNYQTAESNETMYALIKQGGTDYDVIVPSDYMIGQMIAEGMLAELNYDNIPNFSLIGEAYKNLSYDPENKYTVPYTWGTLGIIYNPDMVGGDIDSWGALFDQAYAGQVGMIGNPRDAIGAALLYLGYSVNTTDEAEIRQACQLIADAKAAGVYQGFFMDQLYDKMEAGETAVCTYYAGDFLSMYANNPALRFVVPKEGSNWFVDAMCVLKDAEHKERPRPGSTSSARPSPAWPTWTISGTHPPTGRPWSAIPPTMRSSMGRSWTNRPMRSWPPPLRRWSGARPTSTCPLRR